MLEAGIVDQDVEPAEPADCNVDEALGLLPVRDVRPLEEGLPVYGLELLDRGLPGLLIEVAEPPFLSLATTQDAMLSELGFLLGSGCYGLLGEDRLSVLVPWRMWAWMVPLEKS